MRSSIQPHVPAAATRTGGSRWLSKAALVLSCASVALPRVAAAGENPSRPLVETLTVHPGSTCLEGLMLAEHVQRWLGADTVDARMRIVVRGSQHDPHRADFTIIKGDGYPTHRDFKADTAECVELHSALGLSIALAVRATWIEPEGEYGDAPGVRRAAFAVQALATSGVLGGLAPGAAGQFEVGLSEWLDLRVGATMAYAAHQRLSDNLEGRFDVLLFAGRSDVCGGVRVAESLRVRICLGTMIGLFRTAGSDVAQPEIQAEGWGAAAVGVDAAIDFSRSVGMTLGPDVLVPFWTRRMQVVREDGSSGGDKTLPPWGFVVGIGPVLRVH